MPHSPLKRKKVVNIDYNMDLIGSSLVPIRKFNGPPSWMSLGEEIDHVILSEYWDMIQKSNHAELDSTISMLIRVKQYLTHVTLGYKIILELRKSFGDVDPLKLIEGEDVALKKAREYGDVLTGEFDKLKARGWDLEVYA